MEVVFFLSKLYIYIGRTFESAQIIAFFCLVFKYEYYLNDDILCLQTSEQTLSQTEWYSSGQGVINLVFVIRVGIP